MEMTSICQATPSLGTELRCGPEAASMPKGAAVGAEDGPDAARMQLLSVDGAGQLERLEMQPRLPTTMELFRDVISKQLGREQVLDERHRKMAADVGRIDTSPESFAESAQTMLTLQMAYHEKSMGTALIMSTGKSAESFCKTLMRSQ